jgi:bifunctional UDP-N-acetylglucosamine pyrophosphorylase/glucosamine-1-phosphate N-acetyltransferase
MRISLNKPKIDDIYAIILAAGMGKRMKSALPKVLAPISGKPMVTRIVAQIKNLGPQKIAVVVGHKGELVKTAVSNQFNSEIVWAEQKDQLGTGDATRCGLDSLGSITGTILITAGDTPLITTETLKSLILTHNNSNATATLLSFHASSAFGYGRILRAENNSVIGIREEKDCSEIERKISEVNSGIYAVDSAFLKKALEGLEPKNSQGELYLTDIIAKAHSEGQKISAFIAPREEEFLGVNDHKQLAQVQRIAMNKKIESLLMNGVRMIDPSSVYVEDEVAVESGVVIGPNVQLLGSTKIGANVEFEGSAIIIDSSIGSGSVIKFGVRAEGAKIGESCAVGPFAHLRPDSILESEVKIGNFVEIKKSTLQKGAKASHLSYIGDSEVGQDVNIGAGTITCNYDGYKKSKTVIGAGAFIGSNSSLVAPITIGAGSIVGAGSVITKDVPPDSLSVERSEQREISGWAKRKRESRK